MGPFLEVKSIPKRQSIKYDHLLKGKICDSGWQMCHSPLQVSCFGLLFFLIFFLGAQTFKGYVTNLVQFKFDSYGLETFNLVFGLACFNLIPTVLKVLIWFGLDLFSIWFL